MIEVVTFGFSIGFAAKMLFILLSFSIEQLLLSIYKNS